MASLIWFLIALTGMAAWIVAVRLFVDGRKLLSIGVGLLAGAAFIMMVVLGTPGHPGATFARAADSQGVPLQPDLHLLAAESLRGQQVFVDAGVTPLLFVNPAQSGASLRPIETALSRLKAYRPVMIVGTHFTQPLSAPAVMTRFVRQQKITLPVVIQEGAPALYVTTTPTLIAQLHGHWVRVTGVSAIAAWLVRHDRLTVPTASQKP